MSSILRFLSFIGILVLGIAVIYLGRRLELVKSNVTQNGTPQTMAATNLVALNRELTSLIAKVIPSVVSISAHQVDPAAEQLRRIEQMLGIPSPTGVEKPELGSGMIVSAEGHIITNFHVIKDAVEITVYLNDGRTVSAKFLGADPMVDLAILKINADKLTPLELGNSDTVRVGQLVFAIGNPLGLQETVTQGIISGIGRRAVDQINADFFQTDAAINPGNSGGPLVNVAGEIIGVNNSVALQSQGISFAIPSNLAKRVYDDVVERREISRPWFGAITWPLTPDIANRMGLMVANGSLIVSVIENSPAARAGLIQGDVILAINGKPARNASEIRTRIAELKVGDTAELLIVRESTRMTIPVEVEQQRMQSGPLPATAAPE